MLMYCPQGKCEATCSLIEKEIFIYPILFDLAQVILDSFSHIFHKMYFSSTISNSDEILSYIFKTISCAIANTMLEKLTYISKRRIRILKER